MLCVLNSTAIAWLATHEAFVWLAVAPLIVLQAILMIGVQEIKHQGVHRQFLVGTRLNDAVGVFAAGIFLRPTSWATATSTSNTTARPARPMIPKA
nr:hypothetical protein GCM10020185_75350 [Pseudomonas brassicacearum subsp. brassicacearum]